MDDRAAHTAGPIANFVFAALWLGLGIWAVTGMNSTPSRWILLGGSIVLALGYVAVGLRRLRTHASQT